MNKEYRKELGVIVKTMRGLNNHLNHCARECFKAQRVAAREYEARVRAINRDLARLERRKAILEGRLS